MRVGRVLCTAAAAALVLASIAACDQKLASQPARDHRSVDGLPTTAVASAGDAGEGAGPEARRVEASAPIPSAARRG